MIRASVREFDFGILLFEKGLFLLYQKVEKENQMEVCRMVKFSDY